MRLKERMLKVVDKVVKIELKKGESQYPPICTGFLYQPKRPKNH